MGLKIHDRGTQRFHGFLKESEARVTVTTKQSAYSSGRVIVIDGELNNPLAAGRMSANKAKALLSFQESLVFLQCYSVLLFERVVMGTLFSRLVLTRIFQHVRAVASFALSGQPVEGGAITREVKSGNLGRLTGRTPFEHAHRFLNRRGILSALVNLVEFATGDAVTRKPVSARLLTIERGIRFGFGATSTLLLCPQQHSVPSADHCPTNRGRAVSANTRQSIRGTYIGVEMNDGLNLATRAAFLFGYDDSSWHVLSPEKNVLARLGSLRDQRFEPLAILP